ncbi:MAG: FAD-dependent oxidoreductase [Planctomycetota bacterium]
MSDRSQTTSTLVIGAGITGMTCALKLAASGIRVTVLDKGRRPGGRLATRVSRQGPVFDQGAQFLTARSVTFQQQVAEWCKAGVAALWDRRFVDMKPGQDPVDTVREAKRYVGSPKMASIVEHLCEQGAANDHVDGPHFGVRVTRLDSGVAGWIATDEQGKNHGPFGRVIVTAPAPQARELLAESSPALAEQLAEVETAPTWTTMLGFDASLNLDPAYGGAFVEDSPLAIVAGQATKPGRPDPAKHGECWTLHAALDWSQDHVDDDKDQVAAALTEAFGRLYRHLTNRELPVPSYTASHRWLYGHIVTPLNERWLFDADAGLGYAGDACTIGSPANIERAWLSGLGLAEHLENL